MAARYWVGGSGSWTTTSTTNWSATSGGAGGASVPGVADDVIFNSASSATSYTVIRGTGLANIASIAVSAPASGDLSFSGNSSPTTCVVQGAGVFNAMPLGGTIYFGGSGSSSITTSGTGASISWSEIGLTGTKTYNFSLGGAATTYPALTFASGSSATAAFTANPIFAGITVIGAATTATINLTGAASRIRVLSGNRSLSNAGTIAFTGNTFTGLYWGNISGSGSGTANVITQGTVTPSAYTFYIDVISTVTSNLTLAGSFYNLQFLSLGSTSVVGGTATIGNSFTMASGVVNNSHTLALTYTGSTNQSISCNGNSVGTVDFSAKTGGTFTVSTNVTLVTTGTCWNAASAATVAGSGVITIDSAATSTTRTFAGAGKTYGGLILSGSAVNVTSISGANTFGSMTNAKTEASTLSLPAGGTTTVTGSFAMSGTSGKLLSLNSSASGTKATLSKASGTIDVSYMSIKDSAATGGATWNAPLSTNINAGGNTGWNFSLNNTNFFAFF